MPTLTGSSPFFKTLRRAQIGASALLPCSQPHILRRKRGQSRISFLHPQRFPACRAGQLRESSSLTAVGCLHFVARPSFLASSYVSTRCAAATHPPPNGARPNPLLKRSANGRPPGPGLAIRGTFSPIRARRPAVVARLAHTLGLACPPSQAHQRSLRLSSARSAGHVLSWLAASIALPPARARATNNLFSQGTAFHGMPRGPASRIFVPHAGWAPSLPCRGQACPLPRTPAHVEWRPPTSERCKA